MSDETIWKRQESYRSAALHWNNLANQRLFDFNKQLLGLATILLPLTASIIVVDGVREFEKTLLIVGWIFLGISIITGCIQIMVDAYYFRDISIDSSRRELIFSSNKTEPEMQAAVEALGKIPAESTDLPITIQVFTIFVGLLLIMIVAGSLLWKI